MTAPACTNPRCGIRRPHGGRTPAGMVRVLRADLGEQTRIYCSTACAQRARLADALEDIRS